MSQKTTRPSANQVSISTRTTSDKATTAQYQDRLDNAEGLNAMYAAYRQHCKPFKDSVLAAYINLWPLDTRPDYLPTDPGEIEQPKPVTPKPEQPTPDNPGTYYTVSQYARRKGITGFNSNFASRISRKATREGATCKLTELGVRMYTAPVLEPIFNTLF